MADLYGTNSNSAPNESEEMSSFLHNLLHNSSSAGASNSSPFNSFKVKKAHSFASAPAPAPVPESGEFACGSRFLPHSDSDCRFSDLPGFFPAEAKSGAAAADSDATTSSLQMNFPVENDAGGFDFGAKVPKTSEVPETSAPRSSKRTRAAEIHNLSEKRRRSRINEKLKALQTLIPNSNKTDKASMLDEAIEYLKQLQLQVQMLTMKNGIGLQPIYVQETIPPMQRGMGYDEGDRLVIPNAAGGSFSQNQEIQIGSEFGTFNHHRTNPSTDVPPSTSITRPETPFDLELSIENQYGLLSHLTSYKDVCRANTPSRLHTDLPFSRKTPSPGVSS